MSYNLEFILKRVKDTGLRIKLMEFNLRDCSLVADRLKRFSTVFMTGIEGFYVINEKELFAFGEKLNKIVDVFYGVSERKKAKKSFDAEVTSKYADLLYELDIEYNEDIIFCLEDLNTLIKFLKESYFFNYDDGYYLQMVEDC